MRQFWLPVATVVLLLTGCSPKSEPLPPAPPARPAKVEWPAEHTQFNRRFDEFHLPLVIEIVPPEVPPEIQGPSPPIKEEPKSP